MRVGGVKWRREVRRARRVVLRVECISGISAFFKVRGRRWESARRAEHGADVGRADAVPARRPDRAGGREGGIGWRLYDRWLGGMRMFG